MNCFVYVCKNETAFNRLRQICRRRKLEHRLIGHNLVITYQTITKPITGEESFTVKVCNELQDIFNNKYYEVI